MSFNDYFKRLLGLKSGEATCTRLVRSIKYEVAFKRWVDEQMYLTLTGPFFKAYHYQKANLPSNLRVQIVQNESKRGATFFYDPGIGAADFSFFFDLLKERVKLQGYTLHSCDRLEIRHERYSEQVEKHVLTPPAADITGTSLCNQLYGNILLDYIKVNNQPGYIRVMTNIYLDPYFSQPLPFDELLEKILAPQETRKQ